MPQQRDNIRLAAEGTEFLVLGHLLVEGLQAYKMYTNMPGYDDLVVNPETKPNRVARISVKSRWRVEAHGFLIKNFDSDFVVVVKLNRGTVPAPAEFFVLPRRSSSLCRDPGGRRLDFRPFRASRLPERAASNPRVPWCYPVCRSGRRWRVDGLVRLHQAIQQSYETPNPAYDYACCQAQVLQPPAHPVPLAHHCSTSRSSPSPALAASPSASNMGPPGCDRMPPRLEPTAPSALYSARWRRT